jgi:hypothetical protein
MPVAQSPGYASLVIPSGNQHAAIHRWFHLKEAFSSRLLMRVLKDTGLGARRGLRILDPYSGVGTIAGSAGDAAASGELVKPFVYGIESNPFLHLVASSKLLALQAPPLSFTRFARRLASAAVSDRNAAPHPPGLSTFHNADFFDAADVDQLMRLRRAIERAEAGSEDHVSASLARVALGSVIELVSNLRRDGRALRFVDKRARPATIEAFLERAAQIADDLPLEPVPVHGRIMRGDGRLMDVIDNRFSAFDLIVFSPPYPNNIDYTEVYKLENWLLGYISDSDSFLDQRLRTVYSHPSILRTDPLPSELLSDVENASVTDAVRPIVDAIPVDRYADGRRRMIRGYAVDMFLTFRSARQRLADDGRIVYVVGNSVHGQAPCQFVIAADLLLADLASIAGLHVDRIEVARHLRRRFVSSPYLRESVVFLRHDG